MLFYYLKYMQQNQSKAMVLNHYIFATLLLICLKWRCLIYAHKILLLFFLRYCLKFRNA